jgi:hypothetical protein
MNDLSRSPIRPVIRSIVKSIFKILGGAPAFNPASLFTGGFQGGFYDPSDLSTLWQDSARTTPVTADGDPVGCIDDKSGNGNHLKQATSGKRPLYKTSGGLHWLLFDGVDDAIQMTAAATWSNMFVSIGYDHVSGTEQWTTNTGTANASSFRKFSGNLSLTAGNGASASVASSNTGGAFIEGGEVVAATNSGIGRRNGASLGAITTGGASMGSFKIITIGSASNMAVNNSNMLFYGAVFLGRTATSGEISSTESFIASKSGVTL